MNVLTFNVPKRIQTYSILRLYIWTVQIKCLDTPVYDFSQFTLQQHQWNNTHGTHIDQQKHVFVLILYSYNLICSILLRTPLHINKSSHTSPMFNILSTCFNFIIMKRNNSLFNNSNCIWISSVMSVMIYTLYRSNQSKFHMHIKQK